LYELNLLHQFFTTTKLLQITPGADPKKLKLLATWPARNLGVKRFRFMALFTSHSATLQTRPKLKNTFPQVQSWELHEIK
jgi:hypothetical protein